jgi:hypothetical protein
MILNRYLITNLFLIIIFCLCGNNVSAQNQSILIFDPNQASTSFQSSFKQLSSDSIFVADTLDENINNFDALFLFINPPFVLSQEESDNLIQYTSVNKPAYLFTGFPEGLDTIAFWNHIGIDEMYGLLISVPIDTVFGVYNEFTDGVVIDTSFMSGLIPVIVGNVDSILIGDAESWEVNTTYISGYDTLNVIIDLYNLIDDYDFLQRVLVQFGLIPPNYAENEFNLVVGFELLQNYPNPFNPTTTIKFQIPEISFVTIKVYDVLGNEIETLVNEERTAGSYEVEFNKIVLPSGIYFYRLQAASFVETKKMVLIK